MTEQISNAALSMMQAAALQMEPAKTPAKSDGDSGFQKLLDQKAQSAKTEAQTQEQPKAEKPDAAAQEEGPVQEDAQAMAKRLAQMGLVVADPSVLAAVQADPVVEVQEGPLQVVSLEDVPEGQVITAEFAQDGPVETFQSPVQEGTQPETQPGEEAEARPEVQAVQPREAEQVQAPKEAGARVQVRTAEEAAPEGEKLEVEATGTQQAPQRVFEDVKAPPVKVGETYQLEEAGRVDVAGQIDSGLAKALEKGESYVRIQLNPEELGSVTVEIGQSADGILRVAISAHSGETRNLLERHAADLQGLLSNRTQQDVQVEVQRQQESQQGQNQHPYDGHNGQDQSGRQQEQRQRQPHAGSQDFVQQLRLGLIPAEAEEL